MTKKWSKRRAKQFKEKFAVNEHGVFKLTALGCFMRHDISRLEEPMMRHESAVKEFNTPTSRAERVEKGNYDKLRPWMSNDEISEILNSDEMRGI